MATQTGAVPTHERHGHSHSPSRVPSDGHQEQLRGCVEGLPHNLLAVAGPERSLGPCGESVPGSAKGLLHPWMAYMLGVQMWHF